MEAAMVFHEIYGSYYNVTAAVLSEAVQGTLTRSRLEEIISEKGFGESSICIPTALASGRWPLLRKNMTTPIQHIPTMPLTELQKRWMKAVLQNPRVQLFAEDVQRLEAELDGVKPLFDPDFFVYFDRYQDGDPFRDERYRENFRRILVALRESHKLRIRFESKVRKLEKTILPSKLEYSAKDDRFRLIGYSLNGRMYIIRLGSVLQVMLMERAAEEKMEGKAPEHKEILTLELLDERNALERAMIHFSDLEKETIRLDEQHYLIHLCYREDDEIEILIRILSFGPMLKVTAPERMVKLIEERLIRQKSCGL